MRMLFLISIISLSSCSAGRNNNGKTYKAVTANNEILQPRGDTLYSSNGKKFFLGQRLIIGNPAGENGYFRSIIYKNTAIVPSIWGQDRRYDHAIENHVNIHKSREAVKKLLLPGSSLTIKGIRLWINSKPNFYLVSLAYENDFFQCDLQFALELNELRME